MPTVRYINAQPLSKGDSLFRRLIGLEEPLSNVALRQRYGTRDGYLERFNAALDRMAADRWLVADYATRFKAEEAKRQLF